MHLLQQMYLGIRLTSVLYDRALLLSFICSFHNTVVESLSAGLFCFLSPVDEALLFGKWGRVECSAPSSGLELMLHVIGWLISIITAVCFLASRAEYTFSGSGKFDVTN